MPRPLTPSNSDTISETPLGTSSDNDPNEPSNVRSMSDDRMDPSTNPRYKAKLISVFYFFIPLLTILGEYYLRHYGNLFFKSKNVENVEPERWIPSLESLKNRSQENYNFIYKTYLDDIILPDTDLSDILDDPAESNNNTQVMSAPNSAWNNSRTNDTRFSYPGVRPYDSAEIGDSNTMYMEDYQGFYTEDMMSKSEDNAFDYKDMQEVVNTKNTTYAKESLDSFAKENSNSYEFKPKTNKYDDYITDHIYKDGSELLDYTAMQNLIKAIMEKSYNEANDRVGNGIIEISPDDGIGIANKIHLGDNDYSESNYSTSISNEQINTRLGDQQSISDESIDSVLKQDIMNAGVRRRQPSNQFQPFSTRYFNSVASMNSQSPSQYKPTQDYNVLQDPVLTPEALLGKPSQNRPHLNLLKQDPFWRRDEAERERIKAEQKLLKEKRLEERNRRFETRKEFYETKLLPLVQAIPEYDLMIRKAVMTDRDACLNSLVYLLNKGKGTTPLSIAYRKLYKQINSLYILYMDMKNAFPTDEEYFSNLHPSEKAYLINDLKNLLGGDYNNMKSIGKVLSYDLAGLVNNGKLSLQMAIDLTKERIPRVLEIAPKIQMLYREIKPVLDTIKQLDPEKSYAQLLYNVYDIMGSYIASLYTWVALCNDILPIAQEIANSQKKVTNFQIKRKALSMASAFFGNKYLPEEYKSFSSKLHSSIALRKRLYNSKIDFITFLLE